jgi:hypothetical protein
MEKIQVVPMQHAENVEQEQAQKNDAKEEVKVEVKEQKQEISEEKEVKILPPAAQVPETKKVVDDPNTFSYNNKTYRVTPKEKVILERQVKLLDQKAFDQLILDFDLQEV